MPVRKVPLVTGKFYHVINRGNGRSIVFKEEGDYGKFLKALFYYQNKEPGLKLSQFFRLPLKLQRQKRKDFRKKKDFLVEIIAYCLMPNHFHLLLKQSSNKGISNCMRLVQNSYSSSFGLKYGHKGSLFEDRFKAIEVSKEEQFLHLSRYIHLNPYSAGLVKSLPDLLKYPYSSLPEYLNFDLEQVCQKSMILNEFKARIDYKNFVLDQADYQRSLQMIKNQLGE